MASAIAIKLFMTAPAIAITPFATAEAVALPRVLSCTPEL
jgi:hypothetical protein